MHKAKKKKIERIKEKKSPITFENFKQLSQQ